MSQPKPLPKPVQYALLAAMLTVGGGLYFLMRPATRPCTVKESQETNDHCIVTGKLTPLDATHRTVNAKKYGSTPLDEIWIEDASGGRSIYFDPTKISFAGKTTVTVKGHNVEETAIGARRFLVQSVEE